MRQHRKMRYTKYSIPTSPTDVGWTKFVFISVFSAPIRLLNEISQNLLFVGKDVLLTILKISLALNSCFVVIELSYKLFNMKREVFIPLSSALFSLAVLSAVYWKATLMEDFYYEGKSEEEILDQEQIDLDTEMVFENVSSAPVHFNEPIHLFMQSTEQLIQNDIDPAIYCNEEDDRLLYAINQKAKDLKSEDVMPTHFKDPELELKIDTNLELLMEDLNKQLQYM